MAKFTTSKKSVKEVKTTNYMGEPAYTLKTKERLLNLVATCMVNEPSYYGKKGKIEEDIIEACREDKSKFILQLALYARTELHMRSVSIFLLAIAANIPETKQYVAEYTPKILQRADEIYELLACYINIFGKPIPNSVKKGIAGSFDNFDEYQFAKYTRDTDLTFKDAIMICHPKKPSKIIKKILGDKLKTPDTWEVLISKNGNKPEVWEELIRDKKLGYMATLRNLRNMMEVGIEEWPSVINYITNEKAVADCRMLPHRFLSAYEAIDEAKVGKGKSGKKILFEFEDRNSNTPRRFKHNTDSIKDALKDALNVAIRTSARLNIPRIDGKTIIICDNSGSARGDAGGKSQVSSKSVRTMADTGNLLGLLAWYSSDNTYLGVFGDKLIQVHPDRDAGILDNFKAINTAGERVGQSTEQGVFTMLETMIKERTQADRIIVCSDLQIGDGRDQEYGLGGNRTHTVPELVKQYREKVNPEFIYYSVCFKGYGTDVIVGDKKVLMTGFSDNILKFIKAYETNSRNKNVQIKHIQETY